MLLHGPREQALSAVDWLRERGGWKDGRKGRLAYAAYLRRVAQDEAHWERDGLVGLARGWAIGTHAWRQALAREYTRKSLATGLPREELVDLRQARWAQCLAKQLDKVGKTTSDLNTRPCKQAWKLALASQVREDSGASIAWLATQLQISNAATLRGYLHHARKPIN